MSAEANKSIGWSTLGWFTILILLGVTAFLLPPKWLLVTVPVAMLIWHTFVGKGSAAELRTGGN